LIVYLGILGEGIAYQWWDKMKKENVIKKLQEERELWENLQKYVEENMRGKTLTKGLEKEIKLMLDERRNYLRNLRGH